MLCAIPTTIQSKHREDGNVTPHTLRHTAATWLMQRAVPLWEAVGFLGMSPETLKNTYGHHHPDFMRTAAEAITSQGTKLNRLSKEKLEIVSY